MTVWSRDIITIRILFHKKRSDLRPCDTDTYFRNIIRSNISKILFSVHWLFQIVISHLRDENVELKITYRKESKEDVCNI